MRTLFGKILLWFWFTVAVTVVGSAFISAFNNMNQTPGDRTAPAGRLITFQLEEARTIYETGGRPALAAFMDNLDRIYEAKGVLTDENGRDLLSGEDRSDLIRRARLHRVFQIIRVGPGLIARPAEDGRYWFFLIIPRAHVGSWFLMPEHWFVLVASMLLSWALAYHFTRPVRDLQKAVDRFGQGDLSARVGSTRRDEMGQLSRAFDRMAERIQTLLTAERRLLLDISHELRSPLARLGVAVELARSGDDLNTSLNRIQKESDRLNALVGQLLQVTRAEGDPNSLRRESIRLDTLVEQLVGDAGIEAASHGCRLEYQTREPVTVEGDPELLRRAVENVLRNAIRYAPKESPIEVSLARRNGTAVVDVRDQGPGVPEEALARLFDAFYRVETDRNRTSGGIGLGLSIARRAIELHKGAIRARNRKPGLEIELELPVSKGAVDLGH